MATNSYFRCDYDNEIGTHNHHKRNGWADSAQQRSIWNIQNSKSISDVTLRHILMFVHDLVQAHAKK